MNTHDLISAALERVDEGAVVLRETHSQNLRWANSAVTTNGDMWSATLTVIAAQELPGAGGIGVGVMSGQVNDVEAAAELANLARGAASDGTPIDHVEFPATGIDADFGATAASLDEDTSDRMVSRLGVFLDSPTAQFGYSEATRTTTYLATTAGAGHRHVQDTVRFEASARDSTGSTWWGTNSWTAGFPEAAEAQGHDLRLQRERETLEPGRYPVILSPGAVADLLIYLAWSAGARDAVEGHSVFSRPGGGTRIGELLSPRDLTVFSDPDYPGLQASPVAVVEANSSMESVFDNGLTLQRQDLITAGRLTALRASRPTAQRFDLTPVYLADNLIMVDGQGSGTLQDLIARTSDAVYINCLWYIREVDPQNLLLTGLTRDGVYRVRDGRITAALPNFRFNVAVPDLLGRIRDASGTAPCLPREWADWFTRTAMPALLVDEFNLSSPSDAR